MRSIRRRPRASIRSAPPQKTATALLTFPSALETPHPANNTVYCRLVPARRTDDRRPRAAVLVLPQWNSDENGHVGLCRLLAMNGMTALRLSLPYHDRRMPPELARADYIVSANVARTVQVCRQAVLDARRAIAWLHAGGVRSDWHSRQQPGLMPVAADHGARTADQGPGAEPYLARFRRRRLARPVHPPRARRPRWTHRARTAARPVAADQPALVSGARQRPPDPARLCTLRPDISGRSLRRSGAPVRSSAIFLTSSRCCAAATTAPARRRSSSSTAGS